MYRSFPYCPILSTEKIKKDIIEGKLSPGFPINENELATVLNVSKTPVREALRQLEKENLIENTPGRGSAVANRSLSAIASLSREWLL